MDKADDKQWGREAEQIAADFLLANGYIIREQNWRPKNSKLEVDIIAQIPGTIVFIEVKARRNLLTDPADAVDAKKIRNLVRAANIYLSSVPEDFDYRFDIITVIPASSAAPEAASATSISHKYAPRPTAPTLTTDTFILDHIPDAFLPPLR